ncbi:UNVERIFIED_CONTAM: hypothetical protein RMT77_016700 [Armadillidium vulgare]
MTQRGYSHILPCHAQIQRMTLEQIDLVQGQFNIFVAYMMGATNLNTPNINQTEFDAMVKYFEKHFSLE